MFNTCCCSLPCITGLTSAHTFRLWLFSPQFSSSAKPLSAAFHDTGVDLLCGHDHQRCGVREGGEAEGNHEDHGSRNWDTLVQLVHQQHSAIPGFCGTAHRSAQGKMMIRHHTHTTLQPCRLNRKMWTSQSLQSYFFLSNERIFLVEMICVLKCFIVSRDD